MIEVRYDSRMEGSYPGHVTALLRLTGDSELVPTAEALAELRREFAADRGQRAREGAHLWRSIYDQMGAKPKYRPSVGALLETVEQRGELKIPVQLVELYCWYSLVHGVPMAGYRPERITGALRLTVPGPGCLFTPLGQSSGSREKTKPNEVAYVDDDKVVCRYWNYRDCDETRLVRGIRDVLFVLDLAPAMSDQADALVAGLGAFVANVTARSAAAVSSAAPEAEL